MSERTANVRRETTETEIVVSMNLDGVGRGEIATGVGFFDHMLQLVAKHSLVDVAVQARGDLEVDQHHTVEDVGLALGQCLVQALGDKRGINRYGEATVPMEESLATVALDLSGRPYFVYEVSLPTEKIGGFDAQLIEDFWHAFATEGRLNLHIRGHYGRNTHHIAEAVFKAAARALKQAVAIDPRRPDVPSTKGAL